MKNTSVKLIALALCLTIVSCRTIPTRHSSNIYKSYHSFNKAWNDTLFASKKNIHKAIINSNFYNAVNNMTMLANKNSSKEMQQKFVVSKNEFQKLDLIPMECYNIKENQLSSWDSKTSAESLFTLNRDVAYAFLAKDKTIYYLASLSKTNDNWRCNSMGGLMEFYSDSISNVYFKKKCPIYFVTIESSKGSKTKCVVYNENGNIKYILGGGEYRF